MAMKAEQAGWVAVNQSLAPKYLDLLQGLARVHGSCTLLTGTRCPSARPLLRVVEGPPYKGVSIRARAWSWLRFSAFVTRRLLVGRRPRLVFAASNPPFLAPICWLVSRLRRVPYVLLVWDIYPDHVVQQGWMSGRNPLVRLWRRANRLALRRAGAVVTIGGRMAATLKRQAGDIRIDVIPNWADTEAIRPLAKVDNEFARQHGQTGKVTVLYSGNIGRTHNAAVLADAAALLGGLAGVHFLVIGEGLGLDDLRRRAAELRVANLSLLPLQPWERMPLSLATGDIAVVLQGAGTEHLSVPSKAYTLMAAGCAIVACTAADSDLAELVDRHNIGMVVPAGDAAALAAAIRRLATDPALLAAMRGRARRAAEESFSLERAVSSFAGVFRDCLDAAASGGAGTPAP